MYDISILRAGDPDEEIVGLDVAIYEGLVMDRLNSSDLMRKREAQNKLRAYQAYKDRPSEDLAHHLLRRHTHCFDRKLATAHVKQVLKIGSQEINRKDIVQSLLAKMMNLGNADWIAVGSIKKPGGRHVAQLVRGTSWMTRGVRVPFKVRYERYSSRNWGASDLRGSCTAPAA